MIITISKVAERTKTSKAGKKYKVVEVTGNKYITEEEWTTNIFKNKTDLLEMLDEFGPGDVANFKFVKDGKWPELSEIVEPTPDDLDHAKEQAENGDSYKKGGGGGRKTSGGPSGGGGMSKEEWAEKDRLTNIRIAKAVALKAAIDNRKEGTTLKTIIKLADEIVPWLLDTDINHMGADPEDALDPPTE